MTRRISMDDVGAGGSKGATSILAPVFVRALRLLCERLDGEPVDWAITGSTNFALQGMGGEPRDIDLQTDVAGTYAIERCFVDFVTRPVRPSSTDRIFSHEGALEIEGVEVEIMGGSKTRLDGASWDDSLDGVPPRKDIRFEGLVIPVLSLEYEVVAYRRMGRLEKVRRLEAFLATKAGE